MTHRLDRLERRGLVVRTPNAHDRRGLDAQLTGEGVRLADEMVTQHVANEQQMLARVSERDREQLARITRKLLRHLAEGGGGDSA